MAIDESEARSGPAADWVAARMAAAAELARLDATVFGTAAKVSFGRHLKDLRLTVARLFGAPGLLLERVSGERPWSLAALAEQASFDRHYDAVALAIADSFTLKVHLDIAALRTGFAVFIASLAGQASGPADYRRFVEMVGRLIASLSARRIIRYSALIRDRMNRTVGIVLDYPDEVTALALGAALYASEVRRLTGEDPTVPLSFLVLENAAATFRSRHEAAARFPELLQLSVPWM